MVSLKKFSFLGFLSIFLISILTMGYFVPSSQAAVGDNEMVSAQYSNGNTETKSLINWAKDHCQGKPSGCTRAYIDGFNQKYDGTTNRDKYCDGVDNKSDNCEKPYDAGAQLATAVTRVHLSKIDDKKKGEIIAKYCEAYKNQSAGSAKEKEEQAAICALGFSAGVALANKEASCTNLVTKDYEPVCKQSYDAGRRLALGQDPGKAAPGAPDTSGEDPSCDASFDNPLSWILCPVMEMGAKITDGVFQNLVKPLLQDSPIGVDSDNDFYKVWQSFRNIANIMLIGILLIMVFSQLTEGWGLNIVDAYTAKKMAPRILIGVIAINLSIYLCVAAIDITNIIGNGINYLLTKPFADSGALDARTEGNVESGIVGVLGAGIAGGAIAALVAGGGSLLWLGLMALVPILITVSFAALAVLFTLVVRFGLVVFLVVISPVAIACFILPGTEKYFKSWWNLFLKTLMVYPIIAIIFAMANIMSVIFVTNSTEINDSAGVVSLIVGVVAVFVPVFLIPFSFKFAGGAIGTIGKLSSDFGSKWAGATGKKYNELKKTRGNFIGNAYHQRKENLDNSGVSFGAIGAGIGGARAARRGQRGLRNNLAAMRSGYQVAQESREGTHVVDTAMDYMKNSHTFAAFSGDDDKLWAGIRGESYDDIRNALVERSHARFGADRADGTYSHERQEALDTAAMEVWRAKQEAGSSVFNNAAALGLSTSGTGLDYDEDGYDDNKYRLINDIAGNNRGHATRLLAEMRKNLSQTERGDSVGSFTDDIVNLEASHSGQMTAEQATQAHFEHTADSMGGNMFSMKEGAFRRNMLPAMQRNMIGVLSSNDENAGRRTIQEFATLAGKLDAAGYANPKIARDMADMMQNTDLDLGTLPPPVRDSLRQSMGEDFHEDGTMTYAQIVEALRNDETFGQMRREYGNRAREEADRAGRGAVPGET